MPYHVIIRRKSSTLGDVVALDLDADRLIQRVLTPYAHDQAFIMKGATIPQADVATIRITHSTEESRFLRPLAERARSSIEGNPLPIDWYIAELGKDVTDDIIVGPPGTASSVDYTLIQASEQGSVKPTAANPLVATASVSRNVFVIHGRNSSIRDSMFDFLRAVGLRPLEWSTIVSALGEGSPYIGDIINRGFEMAQVTVALMTPDELATLQDSYKQPSDAAYEVTQIPRVRPNVTLEIGMALARDPNRTILVQVGEVAPISDLAGRHTIRLNNSAERRNALVQRLIQAGCEVDVTGTDWLRVGNFEITA
jgi:predicted nucleotide-binding protein